ncbi:hypothetical protein [Qipengyuania sp. ASV99]
MYSFFELSGTAGARFAAVAGALLVTAIMLSASILPATPAATYTIGALA